VNEFSPSEIEEFIQVKTPSQKSEYILLITLLSLLEISHGKLDTEKAIEGMKKIGFHHLEHKDKTDKDDWWVDIIKKDFKSQLYVHVVSELYWNKILTLYQY
jgi:hypothetical protein